MYKAMKSYFWVVFITILVACIALPSAIDRSPTKTSKPTSMSVHFTATSQPTVTVVYPTLTVSPTPLPLFPLDEYVMFFIKDGDLYYQDGTNSPIKFTHVGKGSYKISDDNRKVVVIDPDPYAYSNQGYSINIDGTQKRSIFPSGWSEKNLLWGTRLGMVNFVPGTHQLILSTPLCNSYDNPQSCVSSIFLSDTDTGEIKKLTDLGYIGPLNNENILISPNGKMVAIMTTSSVDILDMNGKVIRHDILSYKPNTPTVIYPD